MTARTTKRQKLEAMANQTASPAEAEVAKNLLANLAPTPEDRLVAIQQDILSSWSRGIEEEFRIGHLLREAAELLDPLARTKDASGKQAGAPFSDWFKAQDFPFSMKTGYRLRVAAEREPEVRKLIAEKTGRDMGVNTAVAQLLAGPKAQPEGVEAGELIPVTDATPAHPAYAALRTAHDLIVNKGGFGTMHVDDLAKSAGFIKDIAAAYNAAKAERSA